MARGSGSGRAGWQRDVTAGLLGAPRPSVGLAAIPRANGKSSFGGALALFAAVADGQPAPFVPLVATTEEQARRLLAIVVRFVKRHERLAERARVYSDRLVFPCWEDSTVIALPAEPSALLGLDFSFAVLDEIGAMHAETWEAVLTAQGKRPGATVLGIGSRVPGGGELLDDLLAAAEHEPSWALWHWAAPAECELYDEAAWATANPTYGDLVTRETLSGLARTTPEHVFRAFRLNQAVEAAGVWLPAGAWDGCVDVERVVADGDAVVLGMDGSYSGDSTALVGCTIGPDPHLFTLAVWSNPGDTAWRVPRVEVDATVAAAFDRFDVRCLACDPFGWRSEIEAWERTYGDQVVIEWPSNALARIGPACDRFYAAVMERTLSHDGDSTLARHVANCATKVTTYGDVIVKDRRGSPRKIDAAVAAVIAFERSAHTQPVPRSKRLVTF